MQDETEGTRRLRAALRAVMSGGVWLVVAAQVALPFIANIPADAARGAHVVRLAVVTLVLFGLLYVIAGTSSALARGRDPVSIPTALQSGKPVFLPFLWLLLKTGLLAALVVQLGMLAAVMIAGLEAATLAEQATPYVGPLLAALGFVLAYWMPIVFADRNFALFATLREALRVAWMRRRVSGYLAFLALTPALIAALLDAEPAGAVVGALNLVAGVMGWIAYVYCVEWRQSQARAPDSAATSLN